MALSLAVAALFGSFLGGLALVTFGFMAGVFVVRL